MQGIKYLVFFCCGCLLTLVSGFNWSSWASGYDPDPWIELHIENQTDQLITRIHIESWANGERPVRIGVTEYFDVKQHTHLVLPVAFDREGGYRVEFELADGTVCHRQNPKVAPGAYIFEVLEKIDHSC